MTTIGRDAFAGCAALVIWGVGGSEAERYAAENDIAFFRLFGDVGEETAFYFAPVYWAVARGITAGTSATTFSPNQPCTRAQVVTFLHRAEGEPEAESAENPFVDVKKSDYYYDAVLWAAESGVTGGTSDTTFSPNQPCTRGQVVTFLWRAAGEPATYAENPFVDVNENDFFSEAVLWAVANEITAGTSPTTFSPEQTCTRGQVVAFLWRSMAE